MSSIKGALIDLSGTIHIGDNLIPGAIEACRKIQSIMPMKFLTNTTKISSATLLSQLRHLGFDETVIPNPNYIMTSTVAARNMIIRTKKRPLCLLEDDVLTDLTGIPMEDPNCVLVGLAPNAFNYDKLNEAFRLLMKIKTASTSSLDTPHLSEEGINPLIAIHKGKYFKEEDGNLSLGPGPFVTALEYATGFEAVVVGKPCKDFFLEAAHSLGIQPSELVMIGDDVEQDILGSLQAGIGHAVLVKTGKYVPGDEQKIESYQNSSVVDSITNAVENITLNYSLK